MNSSAPASAGPRRLETGGGSFYMEEAGHGPPMVLLHGFALDLRMWDDQFPDFSRAHRAIRYDLRGFGQSSTLDGGPYSHADDLLAVLDALGVDRALVVGLSLGSNVALQFATERPDRLLGLVLASPSLPGHPWIWPGDRPRELAGVLARRDGIEAAKQYWLDHPLFGSARAHPEIAQRLALMTDDYGGEHWRRDDPHTKIPTLQPLLGGIACPTLVMTGGQDLLGYQELARIVAAGIPDAALRAFPHDGHLMNMESPEAFNGAVLEFAARRTGADVSGAAPRGPL